MKTLKTITVQVKGKGRWIFTTSEGSRAIVQRTCVRRQHSTLNGRNSWETRSRKYTTCTTFAEVFVAVAGGEFVRLNSEGEAGYTRETFKTVRIAKAVAVRWLENN